MTEQWTSARKKNSAAHLPRKQEDQISALLRELKATPPKPKLKWLDRVAAKTAEKKPRLQSEFVAHLIIIVVRRQYFHYLVAHSKMMVAKIRGIKKVFTKLELPSASITSSELFVIVNIASATGYLFVSGSFLLV